jgi:hypothetical protein
MSHFLTLVIGDDVTSQLAPYHEYECDGVRDQYVKRISVLDELKKDYELCREKGRLPPDCKCFEDYVRMDHSDEMIPQGQESPTDSNCYCIVNEKGEIIDAIRWTNPNAQWDYWCIGGRYSNIYVNKDGDPICEEQKKEFAFDAMRERAVQEAAERYDKVRQFTECKTWEPWESVFERFAKSEENTGKDPVAAARAFYFAQESIQAINAHPDFKWVWNMRNIDRFLMDRDEFITCHRNRAAVPYAVVKDGKWYAQGEVGWFGSDNRTCTEDEWNKQFNDILDALPDDTLLTVVDCHI